MTTILIFVTIVGFGSDQRIAFGGQYMNRAACEAAGEAVKVPGTRFYCVSAYKS